MGRLHRVKVKTDQRSGKLTKGIVNDMLTKSPVHHHGMKLRLESGHIGEVKGIIQGHNVVEEKMDVSLQESMVQNHRVLTRGRSKNGGEKH